MTTINNALIKCITITMHNDSNNHEQGTMTVNYDNSDYEKW